MFWIQLHYSQEDFKELMEDLNRRMARRSRFLHYRIDDIKLDNVIAMHCDDGVALGIAESRESSSTIRNRKIDMIHDDLGAC